MASIATAKTLFLRQFHQDLFYHFVYPLSKIRYEFIASICYPEFKLIDPKEIRTLEQSIERSTRDPRQRIAQFTELKVAMDRLGTVALQESDKLEYIDKVHPALVVALANLGKLQERYKMYQPTFLDPNGKIDNTLKWFVEEEIGKTYIERYKAIENDLLIYKSELCKRICEREKRENEEFNTIHHSFSGSEAQEHKSLCERIFFAFNTKKTLE